jgi:addiction module RelE/StbE family toxin
VRYEIRFSRQAEKDIRKLTPKVKAKLMDILRNRIAVDPYAGKALVGDLQGYYSVRLTYQDRIVYSIEDEKLTVYVVRTHDGE